MYFQIKGIRPMWVDVYENVVRGRNVNDVITFAELAEAIPHSSAPRAVIYRVRQELERQDHRTLESVRGEGWRVAEARDHERLGRAQWRRGRRRVARAGELAQAADRNMLTQDETNRLDALELNARQQADLMRRFERRLTETEQRLGTVEKEKAGHDDRISRLEEQLRRRGLIDS